MFVNVLLLIIIYFRVVVSIIYPHQFKDLERHVSNDFPLIEGCSMHHCDFLRYGLAEDDSPYHIIIKKLYISPGNDQVIMNPSVRNLTISDFYSIADAVNINNDENSMQKMKDKFFSVFDKIEGKVSKSEIKKFLNKLSILVWQIQIIKAIILSAACYKANSPTELIGINPEPFDKNQYEDICNGTLLRKDQFAFCIFANPFYPSMAHYVRLNIDGHEFPNCGEATVMNFLTILAHDTTNNLLSPQRWLFEKNEKTEKLAVFFNKHATTKDIGSINSQSEFSKIISYIDGVVYKHEDTVELTGGYIGFTSLIVAFFKVKDMPDFFRKYAVWNNENIYWEEDIDGYGYGKLIFIMKNTRFILQFSKNHFGMHLINLDRNGLQLPEGKFNFPNAGFWLGLYHQYIEPTSSQTFSVLSKSENGTYNIVHQVSLKKTLINLYPDDRISYLHTFTKNFRYLVVLLMNLDKEESLTERYQKRIDKYIENDLSYANYEILKSTIIDIDNYPLWFRNSIYRFGGPRFHVALTLFAPSDIENQLMKEITMMDYYMLPFSFHILEAINLFHHFNKKQVSFIA
ncbi:hypothetical protein O9G_005731 [Rozella allomycis CSF55]|uniref:Uncharacterized protein n=1 Tax=Rozella allomycis (strain CSF55) TaxID=988480 RepID=A0A075AUJ2_ROZAC|nr:hypothetical protein O9G_005731 [Rozella allomycis CSF55]|eukprot:EPZ32177.1 hypothetical protein O9G_005731 [Rozella allomycis CSF55]